MSKPMCRNNLILCMKTNRFWILLLICFSLFPEDLLGCTSIIITGKLTKDGRPLLLKQRDGGNENNRIESFHGEKYDFITLVNSEYVQKDLAWCGINEMGLAITSNASNNLGNRENGGYSSPKVIYLALAKCKNLQEFECLLDSIKLFVPTNFGAIDAGGGAAYYEVGETNWTKFDVNDPSVAPDGYLVRTNFSFSGNMLEQNGIERYRTANKIVAEHLGKKDFSAKWIFNNICRSFRREDLKHDLSKLRKNVGTSTYFDESKYIASQYSVASVVFQGVRVDESPRNAVMWTLLGWAPTGFVVPLQVNRILPAYVQSKNDTDLNSILCDQSIHLKRRVFIKKGNLKELDKQLLFGSRGLLNNIRGIERNMFGTFEKKGRNFSDEELHAFYGKYNNEIMHYYQYIK